ncbi:TraM recognition domain-containing protein [Coraliomargarita algicola]|uniref:TraM recognition domain-containing protein n=1 Tax=Coraliomargarita algicola TaxID=3092156 RepID=A0ABZ0RJ90_9BACT|nr:TraM recognition domain-containing protein [Coraliomargarita sp. J2-16]WPJ95143.1 TraM recognition domain-containing protein [Coraliomargarita sp. J2-16]
MNDPLINLKCFEPAGSTLDFSEDDLLGHTLAIGGSGSGKTSRLIHPIISQLVQVGGAKVGMCILDTKADGSMEAAVRRACFEAEREDDLVVINGEGNAHLNIFNDMENGGLESIDRLTSLLGSLIPRDERNKYWENTFEALIRQTLRLIHLSENIQWDYNTLVKQLIRYLLLHQLRDIEYVKEIDALKDQRDDHDPSIQLIVDEVVATHKMWDTLDHRTRSILQSMAATLAGPMNSETAFRYFDGGAPIDISTAVNEQKIVLISIDGIRHPECSRLLSRFAKGLFYEAILEQETHRTGEPIAGLILDDWPICVTAGTGNRYSDIDALAMIRSRGGFVVAATQSLAALDVSIGKPSRDAALANFANLVFFRGRDPEVDAMAAAYLGMKTEVLTDTTIYEGQSPTIRRHLPSKFLRQIRTPAVPPGAIARLATGDAYAIVGSSIYNEALSLVPLKQNQNIPW